MTSSILCHSMNRVRWECRGVISVVEMFERRGSDIIVMSEKVFHLFSVFEVCPQVSHMLVVPEKPWVLFLNRRLDPIAKLPRLPVFQYLRLSEISLKDWAQLLRVGDSFWPFIFPFSFLWSLPKANDERWHLDYRLTGKSKAFSFPDRTLACCWALWEWA